jgi:hypothetical protein
MVHLVQAGPRAQLSDVFGVTSGVTWIVEFGRCETVRGHVKISYSIEMTRLDSPGRFLSDSSKCLKRTLQKTACRLRISERALP